MVVHMSLGLGNYSFSLVRSGMGEWLWDIMLLYSLSSCFWWLHVSFPILIKFSVTEKKEEKVTIHLCQTCAIRDLHWYKASRNSQLQDQNYMNGPTKWFNTFNPLLNQCVCQINCGAMISKDHLNKGQQKFVSLSI